ncbi:MAG: C10 family peptidase [Muribaculaceae bacterium]|nr:C10 family peptidase [Muribaculaceae bacterium]
MIKSHYQGRLFALALSGLTALGLHAAHLSPQEALQRLKSDRNRVAASKAIANSNPRYLGSIPTEAGKDALYLYTLSARPGYLILAADDRLVPMLGYSETGTLNNTEELPDGLKWWMNQIADEINYMLTENDDESAWTVKLPPSVGPAIAPLVSARWGQTDPYNAMTPIVNEKQSPTGCVATALTQIMYHYSWPPAPKGSITYKDTSSDKVTRSMTFDGLQFEWEKMLDVYSEDSPQDAIDAVALLMKAVGHGVKMTYGASSSGATDDNAKDGMINYFGYSKDMKHIRRESFTRNEWENILYSMLSAGMPIYYTGRDAVWLGSGGHAFVCDGYDGQGYFHFNWGWNDKYNGYFLTTCMVPAGAGTGGYINGYNYTQSIMVNMHPDDDREYSLVDYVIGTKFEFNSQANSIIAEAQRGNGKSFEAGLQFCPTDAPEDSYIVSLGVAENSVECSLPEDILGSLDPGKTYEVKMVWRADNGKWQRVAGQSSGLAVYNQYPMGGYMTYDDGKWNFVSSLTDLRPIPLMISDITFNDEDYYLSGSPNSLTFYTTNLDNDYEYHGARCYAVDESGKQTLFFNFTLEVDPEEVHKSSFTLKDTLTLPKGVYTLRFIDVNTLQEIPIEGEFILKVYDQDSILTHDDGCFKYVVIPGHDATLLQTSTGSTIGGDIFVPSEISIDGEAYKVGKMQVTWRNILDKKKVTSLKIDYPLTEIASSSFSSMDILEELSIPETVKVIGQYAGAFNKVMTKLTIPERLDHIDKSAFFACYMLKELRVPAVDTIPESCFYGVYEVPELRIPEGVRVIEKQGFYSPKVCEYIELPSTLESIGSQGFGGYISDSKLKEVKIHALTPPAIESNSFASNQYKTAVLKVPGGTKTSYISDPVWSKFSNIEEFDSTVGIDIFPIESDPFDAAKASETWYTTDGLLLTSRPTRPGLYIRIRRASAPEKVLIAH